MTMNEYPMLHFIVRWGKPIAMVLAAVAVAAGLWGAAMAGNVLWAVLGLGGAALGYGLLMSYVELVKLVMDMLLPK
jgi:hypothetical protein